jgi:hypothetical protein
MIPPVSPDARRSDGRMSLRYEDITQDGFLRTVAMPHAMGRAFWQSAANEFLAEVRGQGIHPILTNLRCAAGEGPIGLLGGLTIDAHYDLAHVARDDEVERIVLRVWGIIGGPRGRIHGPPPRGAGELIEVGRVYGEHVFTKLFAPPGERRVSRLSASSLPSVPATKIERVSVDDVLALPAEASWSSDWECDPAPIVLGIDDSDANQHVNSLVYPALFRQAALRALARRGEAATQRVVSDELLFRKPCFAGEELAIEVRAFVHPRGSGAVLRLIDPAADSIRTASRLQLARAAVSIHG